MVEKERRIKQRNGENKMKKNFMKTVLAGILVTAMSASSLTGCKPKVAEVEETPTSVETVEKETRTMNINAERRFTAIEGETITMSHFIRSVDIDEGLFIKGITIDYLGTSFTVDETTDIDELEMLTEDLFYTLAVDENIDNALDSNVLNFAITFTDVVLESTPFEVTYVAIDSDGDEVMASASIMITVVPAVVAEISEVTDNLAISTELDNYNFETRARNITQNVNEDSNIGNITVKTNDVKFNELGNYDVAYEIELKESIIVKPAKPVVIITPKEEVDVVESDVPTEDEHVVPDESVAPEDTTELEVPEEETKEIDVIEVPVEVDIVDPKDEEVTTPVIEEDIKEGEIVEPTPEPEVIDGGNTGNDNGNTGSGNTGGNTNPGNGNSGNTGNNGNTGGNTTVTDPNAGKTWVEGHYATREVQKTRQVDNWVDEGRNETTQTPYTVWIISQTGEEFTDVNACGNAIWAYFDAGITHYTTHSVVRYKTTTTWVPKMVNRPKTETYTETEQYWVAGHWK